jgi:hypothetical protein
VMEVQSGWKWNEWRKALSVLTILHEERRKREGKDLLTTRTHVYVSECSKNVLNPKLKSRMSCPKCWICICFSQDYS